MDYAKLDSPLITEEQLEMEISNKLICPVTKCDLYHKEKPIFGYPIHVEKDGHGRLWPVVINEIYSKEGLD